MTASLIVSWKYVSFIKENVKILSKYLNEFLYIKIFKRKQFKYLWNYHIIKLLLKLEMIIVSKGEPRR